MSNQLIQYLNQYSNDVELPSIYKTVSIRPITTGQMKRVLAYSDNDDPFVIDDILDDIINDCVTTEDFNINDISIQDRFSLIINIRKITKGDIYTFHTKCPECKTELINIIDINKMKNNPYPEKINPIIKLTDTLSANMSFMTRGMQKKAVNIVRNDKTLNEDQKMVEMATYLYAIAINSFETPTGNINNASVNDKKELLDNLSEKTYENITNWFKEVDYGYVFTYKPHCRFCKWEDEEQDIPLSSFFF